MYLSMVDACTLVGRTYAVACISSSFLLTWHAFVRHDRALWLRYSGVTQLSVRPVAKGLPLQNASSNLGQTTRNKTSSMGEYGMNGNTETQHWADPDSLLYTVQSVQMEHLDLPQCQVGITAPVC